MTRRRRFYLVILGIVVLGGVLAARYRMNEHMTEPSPGALQPLTEPGLVLEKRRQQLIGIRTARATRGSLPVQLRTVGVVQYDEARLTDINLKLDGWLNELYVNYVGQSVKKGQPLFTVFSQELLDVQNELFRGLRNVDEAKAIQGTSTPDFGERVVDVPRQKLLRWDVPAEIVRGMEENRRLQSAVEFRSPTDGVVIERSAVKGMHVERGQTLYRIGDLSLVWIDVEFRELDLPELRVGALARVVADAWPGQQFSGTIGQVYPYLSEATRSVRARISVKNPDGNLKPGMFVNVEVSGAPREGIRVPTDAVLDSGHRQVVFVAKGEGRFEPRDVTVGSRGGEQVVILSGLEENEEVVTRAAFLLDSESRLRSAFEEHGPAPRPDEANATKPALNVTVQTSPTPPTTGENTVEVAITDHQDQPVTDANVEAVLLMPAMPSMNMPAMRADASLTHVTNGMYRGAATIQMGGRWEMTITVFRGGRAVAETRTSLLAH